MAKGTKHISGAGNSPRKTKKRIKDKGFKPEDKTLPNRPKPPKPKPSPKPKPKPMPYYPETGSNERPGSDISKLPRKDLGSLRDIQKEFIIKLWEDRNRDNNGTKLNP